MEVSWFRVLLLTALCSAALPGCAWFGRGNDAPPEPVTASAESSGITGEPASDGPIIEPKVARREIKRPRIDTEDFELGAYVGILSIEDFESNVVYGARLAYHLTEDFFLEATAGQSRAGRTSYENLSGSAELLTDSERDYTYYALSIGWNALPGEIFVGKNRAYNSAFVPGRGPGRHTVRRRRSFHRERRLRLPDSPHRLARRALRRARPRVRHRPPGEEKDRQ